MTGGSAEYSRARSPVLLHVEWAGPLYRCGGCGVSGAEGQPGDGRGVDTKKIEKVVSATGVSFL